MLTGPPGGGRLHARRHPSHDEGGVGVSRASRTIRKVGILGKAVVPEVAVFCVILCCACAQALALPAGRVYEQVSPVYKGGYGVAPKGILTVAKGSGETGVAFWSFGAFAGVPSGPTEAGGYLARRDGSAWSTTPLTPPATLQANPDSHDLSPGLETSFSLGESGRNSGTAYLQTTEITALLHQTTTPDVESNFAKAGDMIFRPPTGEPFGPNEVKYKGASSDFCHILLAFTVPPLGSEDGGTLYELDGGCHGGTASLRLVGASNQSKPINGTCLVEPGSGVSLGTHDNSFNAVAAGGSELFFTTNVETGTNPNCYSGIRQLFVRLAGARTLEVSRPLGEACEKGGVIGEVPCDGAAGRASAEFSGASEDGSRVFFTTVAPLTSGDGSNNLYMAQIACPGGARLSCLSASRSCNTADLTVRSLTEISRPPTGPGEVRGVLGVAPDGSRAYFVARGVLTEGSNAEGHTPVSGADNLYVYECDSRYPEGRTAFITDLCSGPEESGVAQDVRCPTTLKSGSSGTSGTRSDVGLYELGIGEAQTAGGDGRFLVFSSYGQLVASDTDAAKDVYRYDAQSGALVRVSLGEAGYDANGNDEVDATIRPSGSSSPQLYFQRELGERAISEDGSRIVFTTAGPLSRAAINGLPNVYEWREVSGQREGVVSIVSSGSAVEPDEAAVITPDGRDVVFETSAGLVPQDTDGALDVYDARMEGGFPESAAEREPCASDACKGPLMSPAPLLVPGSASQAAGENLPPPARATPKKLTRAQQLARALKACAKTPKSRRSACRRNVRAQYAKSGHSVGRGGR